MVDLWMRIEVLLDFMDMNKMASTSCEGALPRMEALYSELEQTLAETEIEKDTKSAIGGNEQGKDEEQNGSHPHADILSQQLQQDFALTQLLKEWLTQILEPMRQISEATSHASVVAIQQQLHQMSGQIRRQMEQHSLHIAQSISSWLSDEGIEDFYVLHHTEQGKLVVAGSRDYSYYHNVELTFHDVRFLMLPVQAFRGERLRLASAEEQAKLHEVMYGHEREARVFCLESLWEKQCYYVVARQLSYNLDTVFYYDRKPLQAGERLAEFLK